MPIAENNTDRIVDVTDDDSYSDASTENAFKVAEIWAQDFKTLGIYIVK